MIECNLMSMREWNCFLRIMTGGVEGWNRIGDYCWGLPPPDPRVCHACLRQRPLGSFAEGAVFMANDGESGEVK